MENEENNIKKYYKIIHNRIKCNECGDIIESFTRHDFKYCSCGKCAVDGGKDYLRRCFAYDGVFEELSIIIYKGEKYERKDQQQRAH